MTYLGGKWRNELFHVWDIATSYQLAAEDFRTAVGLRAPHLRTELVCDPEAHPAMGPGNWSHRLGDAAFGSCPGNLTCAYMYQFSCSVMSDSLRPHGLQHARLPCPSPAPGPCSNSCSLSWWCHLTISFSVSPSPAFGLSHLPMNIQDWFPLGLTGWTSLLSKGLSRVLSNTTVQKH